MPRTFFSDNRWEKLLPILKSVGISHTRQLRKVIEGIFWRLRTGAPWRDLPSEFGCWSSIFNRFNQWSKAGKLEFLFESIKDNPDLEFSFIDGSVIRAHQHSTGAAHGSESAIGSSSGGRSTKIHMLTDAHGNPITFKITEGQQHDVNQAKELMELSNAEYFVGDKGYDSDEVRSHARKLGITPIVPMRKNSLRSNPEMDYEIYKWRHLVENLFARIKHFRAVATRYDKLARNYIAVLALVCAYLWLNLI